MAQDRRKDRHRDRHQGELPFCGVDGEGGNIPDDSGVIRHEYLLLRAGEFALEPAVPGHTLSYFECLPFLADLPKDRIYVSFFFDYDVTMMLRKMPVERLKRLLDIECRRVPGKPCSSFPIDFGPYQIDYVPKKEFRVRRRPALGQKQPWTIIHDVGTFFQSSFVVALEKWFKDEPEFRPVIERIREGKDQRNEFGHVTMDTRDYNLLEIRSLEKLMHKFRLMCHKLDIRPGKWQGPGNLVSAVFKREGLPGNSKIELFDNQPDLMRMANDAYYGGRFEPPYFGDIPGPIYQYDINSAYANTYRQLPCLLHGRWSRLHGDVPTQSHRRIQNALPGSTKLFLADVTFHHPSNLALGTLPIRTKKGSLIFPLAGRGTYWSPELAVAHSQGVRLTIHSGWEYTNDCDCQHFDFIDKLYAERQRLGKDGAGLVLKIVLASIYGKLAQSVGCAPYSNPIWAGLIVSLVRALLASAALQLHGGRDVLMLATDGLFTRSPRNLELGSGLGQWDLKTHDSMFIVQSGVYFLPDTKPKTRGLSRDIRPSKLEECEGNFRETWANYLRGKPLTPIGIPLETFIGLRLALHRNKPELAGQWLRLEGDKAKKITFDWTSKRTLPRIEDTYVVTAPIAGSPELRSEAYNRIIGGIRVAERLLLDDQPDWGDQL
jgi:hypothetical protein